MRRIYTTNFVVALIIALAMPAMLRGDGQNQNNGVPDIALRVLGLEADCKIGVFRNGWDMVYNYANVPGGSQPLYPVPDTGEDYTVRLSKNGFYSIDANVFRVDYGTYEELWAFFDCFYRIKVPTGVSNVSIASLDWCVRNAKAGDTIDLIVDWYNVRNARMEFDFGGAKYSVPFKLDGSDPFAGMVFVNFPGVEGVTIQYRKGNTWFNLPGTFSHGTGFITIPTGVTSLRAVKGAMSYQFDGLNIGLGPKVFNVPVIGLRVLGLEAECKISVLLNEWDVVYNSATVAGGVQPLYHVFDNGGNYTVRMSKNGFYSVDANAFRVDYGTYEELWAYYDCFYRIKVPAGVSNVSISSWDWCVRNANAGDTIDLIVDWYNIRNARLEFVFEGTNRSVNFKLDGSNPFFGLVPKL